MSTRYTKLSGVGNGISFAWNHGISYPCPATFTYAYSFGFLALTFLVVQVLSGIFLAMHYAPEVNLAFASVEHIMRDVNNGWVLRYMHANGASMFFLVVYMHMIRGFYYGSYVQPRGHLWASGIVIFLLMTLTGFMGYVLPWGQMSLWGATVIFNLVSAVPGVGQSIVEWIWGGFSVGNPTLNRVFSLHYLMPFVLLGLAILHILLLHEVSGTNPLGTETVFVAPFQPYFWVKDFVAFTAIMMLFSFLIFFEPNMLGHPDNYIMSNPMVTPPHIVPEWYLLPFYAILRSIPNKLGGVIAMGAAILVPIILSYTNTSPIRSSVFRPVYKALVCFFVVVTALLGWCGQMVAESPIIEFGQILTFLYFFILTVGIPAVGILEGQYGKDGLFHDL